MDDKFQAQPVGVAGEVRFLLGGVNRNYWLHTYVQFKKEEIQSGRSQCVDYNKYIFHIEYYQMVPTLYLYKINRYSSVDQPWLGVTWTALSSMLPAFCPAQITCRPNMVSDSTRRAIGAICSVVEASRFAEDVTPWWKLGDIPLKLRSVCNYFGGN